MRICRDCGKPESEVEFVRDRSFCVTCRRKYTNEWYARNREKHGKRVAISKKARHIRHKEMVQKLKDVPCTDCAQKFPYYVMDFDHLEDDKEFCIAEALGRGLAVQRLLDEIGKCEVVCANCHRIRTHLRRLGSLA